MPKNNEEIGKLNRIVTIQLPIVGVNDSNEDEETGWELFWRGWARVDEKSGGEYYRDDKLTAATVADFYIRYQVGIKENMRIVFNDRRYNIKSIIFVDRKRFIKITAESGGEYVELSEGPGFSLGFTVGFNS